MLILALNGKVGSKRRFVKINCNISILAWTFRELAGWLLIHSSLAAAAGEAGKEEKKAHGAQQHQTSCKCQQNNPSAFQIFYFLTWQNIPASRVHTNIPFCCHFRINAQYLSLGSFLLGSDPNNNFYQTTTYWIKIPKLPMTTEDSLIKFLTGLKQSKSLFHILPTFQSVDFYVCFNCYYG